MNKTAGYEVFAPALVTSLANAKALCPTCHIKEFHNPKTETRQSYIDQVGLVMQAYLTAMTDPSLDDWRTDLVQSANNNYYKPKPRRKRAKKRK